MLLRFRTLNSLKRKKFGAHKGFMPPFLCIMIQGLLQLFVKYDLTNYMFFNIQDSPDYQYDIKVVNENQTVIEGVLHIL